MDARSRNQSYRAKAINITYWALSIQYAMRMCHIVTCSLSDSTVFPTFSQKLHDFRRGGGGEEGSYWTQNGFWFSLQILPETFLILRRTERDKIKNINWSSRKKVSVICFLLGNSPASEFYMPTFRNHLSVPSSKQGRCRMTKLRNIGVFIWDVPVYPNISQPQSF